MKLLDLTCTSCGAKLQIDSSSSKCFCQYCGNEMILDKEIQEHKLIGGYEFGYDQEMGRLKAQKDFEEQCKREEQIKQQRKAEQEEKQRLMREEETQRQNARMQGIKAERHEKNKAERKYILKAFLVSFISSLIVIILMSINSKGVLGFLGFLSIIVSVIIIPIVGMIMIRNKNDKVKSLGKALEFYSLFYFIIVAIYAMVTT